MAILSHGALGPRLHEIFAPGTFTPDKVKEASYDLRVAQDGLWFSGEWRPFGATPVDDIKIGAGEIAVLSTQEQFTMPDDLVGIVNIKFKSALRGLTLVFGSRVDPGYGRDLRSGPPDPYKSQRLYLLVYNISDRGINVRPGDALFMVEFHTTDGHPKLETRQNNDTYVAQHIREVGRFGFLAGVGSRVGELEKKVGRLEGIERYVNYVVLGAAVLLGVTLLGVVLSFWLSLGSRGAASTPTPAVIHGTTEEMLESSKPGGTAAREGRVVSVAAGIVVTPRSTSVFSIGDIGVVIRIVKRGESKVEERYIASVRFVESRGDTFVVRAIGAHDPILVGDAVRRVRTESSP